MLLLRRFASTSSDQNFANAAASAGNTLDLPNDSYVPPETTNHEDRMAGAVILVTQIQKARLRYPVSVPRQEQVGRARCQ